MPSHAPRRRQLIARAALLPLLPLLAAGCASSTPPAAAVAELAPGTRVVVGRGSADDLDLTRALKAASLVHAPSAPAVTDLMLAQQLEAAAGVKQQLQAGGFVAAALQRHGIQGAAVAPPR